MPDEYEASPILSADPVLAPSPPPEATGPALTVWHWYNTQIAGQVSSVASLSDADAHLRAKIPALIAALEQKV